MENYYPAALPDWQKEIEYPGSRYSTFSGADIKCAFYFPNVRLTNDGQHVYESVYKLFAEIQTLTVSSMRTVDPVRVLGRTEAAGFTRGPRTIAGSLIFTDIVKDVLIEVIRMASSERTSKYEFFVDQIPEFNIILNAHNEAGVSGVRVITGVVLANYGTTYSIDDLFTESTYTYMARGVTPLLPMDQWRGNIRNILRAAWDPSKAKRASALATKCKQYFLDYEERIAPKTVTELPPSPMDVGPV